MLNNRGYSLIEVTIVILITSVVILSCSTLFVYLHKENLKRYQQLRQWQLADALFHRIQKDIRRAGFNSGLVDNKNSLLIGQYSTMPASSCIVISYDLSLNGGDEHFAYRWFNGAIEQRKGERSCGGKGWERVSDPNELLITEFKVESISARLFKITLAMRWPHQQSHQYREVRYAKTVS